MTTTSASVNPFDDETYQFCVLLNQAGDYSLWPEFAAIPAGWQVVLALCSRQQCLDYVDTHWLSIQSAPARSAHILSDTAPTNPVPGER